MHTIRVIYLFKSNYLKVSVVIAIIDVILLNIVST